MMMNNTFTFLTIINVNFCICNFFLFKLFKLTLGNVITDYKKFFVKKKTLRINKF